MYERGNRRVNNLVDGFSKVHTWHFAPGTIAYQVRNVCSIYCVLLNIDQFTTMWWNRKYCAGQAPTYTTKFLKSRIYNTTMSEQDMPPIPHIGQWKTSSLEIQIFWRIVVQPDFGKQALKAQYNN